jgi:hypothetical protein
VALELGIDFMILATRGGWTLSCRMFVADRKIQLHCFRQVLDAFKISSLNIGGGKISEANGSDVTLKS